MRPLDGSGSRSKEKKPADGRLQARLRISPGLPTILVGSYSLEYPHSICLVQSLMTVAGWRYRRDFHDAWTFEKLRYGTMTAENLAKRLFRNPSLVPDVINGVSSHKSSMRFACAKALRILSNEKPEMLYPEFDHFVELLGSTNNIIKWNVIDVLANLTVIDDEKRFEPIFDKYCGLPRDTIMITAAHVIDNSPTIAKSKPSLANRITAALLEVEQLQRHSPECRNILIGKAIVAFDGYFEQIEGKDKVMSFVKRQMSNSRNATRAKAHRFLERRVLPNLERVKKEGEDA